jgi:hypothetical protein
MSYFVAHTPFLVPEELSQVAHHSIRLATLFTSSFSIVRAHGCIGVRVLYRIRYVLQRIGDVVHSLVWV